MVPPTLWIASDGKQILGNHTPAHIALEAKPSFIGSSRHREGVFQGADGGFNPGPPAQRAAEPALLLLLGTRFAESRPRAGSATFFTPRASASRWFFAEKNPRSPVAISGTRPKLV